MIDIIRFMDIQNILWFTIVSNTEDFLLPFYLFLYLFKGLCPVNKAIPQQVRSAVLLLIIHLDKHLTLLSQIFIKESKCFLPRIVCRRFIICWLCFIEECMLCSTVQLHFKGLFVFDHTLYNNRDT